jgi:hypothetical protein
MVYTFSYALYASRSGYFPRANFFSNCRLPNAHRQNNSARLRMIWFVLVRKKYFVDRININNAYVRDMQIELGFKLRESD